MARPLTCAAVQMRSTTDIAVNRDDLERLVREAAGRGATYVQTPEMTGLIQKNRPTLLEEISPEAEDPIAATASSLAKDLGIWLHVGSTPIALGDGKVANAWLRNENRALGGRPLDQIKTITGLTHGLAYLDSRRAPL